MAVDAVASVVLQKLRDWLAEDSFMKNQRVIGDQLQWMQDALEEMSGFFMDAANKETNDDLKEWINRYIQELYSVEDAIESFALRITRQRKRYGFLMNHALFLKKFTACKKLGRKVKKIRRNIEELNVRKPTGLKDASLRGKSPRQNSIPSDDKKEDIGEEELNLDPGSSYLCRYYSSPTATIEEGDPSPRNPNSIKKLRRSESSLTRERFHSYSNNEQVVVTKLRNSPSTVIIKEEGPSLRKVSSFKHTMLRRSEASLMRERYKHSMLTHSYSYNEEELSIIGYKSRVTKLWNRLETADDRIISIVGEPGSGKTMLARAIYGNRDFKNRFKHACAWVTIFKESNPEDILLNLVNQLQKSNGEEDSRMSEDPLDVRISCKLKTKRYLIVLDGVQSMDQWELLKVAFPDARNESKIIVTTCERSVATLVNSKMEPHMMGYLRPQESWALFARKVGFKEEEEEVDHQVFVRERIIEVCRGLPLNIVLLGSLLSIKDRETWSETLDDTQKKWETSDIVMLSYNDLDPHMKLCLLYMMMFPKDLDIPVRRLQRLWLAEGFVKRADGKFEEDVAQDYFQNLVKRSLIMVTKLRSDGSHRKCRLLEALHDHLLPNARHLSLFHVHGVSNCNEDGPSDKRRLIEFADGNNCSLSLHQSQHLRSYISFNLQKKDTPAEYVGDLVGKMIGKGYGLLRVLDLEGVYKPSLPENLGDLFHLRYLGLRWTFLDRIPKSVGELPYLETLDLKHTFINKIPQSIWKLKHLRHLNLNEIHLDKDSCLHKRKSLPQLLTLWGLSVDQDCPIENGLSKFTHLRELGISLRFSKSSSSETRDQVTRRLLDWISKLTDLRQLRLRSKDDSGNPADLHFTPFSALEKLSHMKLLGKLQKLPQTNHFPPHIKVLTLSVSCLQDDPMPVLGQLPELTVLRLLANSYMGDKMICPPGSFKNLLDLKLWMLCNLKKWQVEKGAMEKLKELNVRFCPNLENIPAELLQQKAFQDLILNDMPDKFKKNAEEINDGKQGKFSITVKDYGFRMEDYQ
ncbi:hypothetical protein ACS0TY_013604 [Phlomoides rotata]